MVRDNFFLGFLLGLIVPILGIALFYTIRFVPDNVSVSDFLYLIKTNKSMIPKVISLGMIACIPLITYYKNRRLYTTLKGIFVSIILYASIAIMYKFHVL
jgi:hypothetical protein